MAFCNPGRHSCRQLFYLYLAITHTAALSHSSTARSHIKPLLLAQYPGIDGNKIYNDGCSLR